MNKYFGDGKHSVKNLETMVKQRDEEIHQLKLQIQEIITQADWLYNYEMKKDNREEAQKAYKNAITSISQLIKSE